MTRLVKSKPSGNGLPFQQIADTFVRGIAASEHFAVEQDAFTGFPCCHLFLGQRVQISRIRRGFVGEFGPTFMSGASSCGTDHQYEVRMTRGGAVGNDRHG
jgi:hypothetical protein